MNRATAFVQAVLDDKIEFGSFYDMNPVYDQAVEAMQTEPGEVFDLLPALSFHFSNVCDTKEKYEKAKAFMLRLTAECLDFNMAESENSHITEQ